MDDHVSTFHEWSCSVCRFGGWPLTSAYRPHTLDESCWCANGMCHEALVYDLASPPAKRPPARAANPALGVRIDHVIYDEICHGVTADDFYRAYQDSVRDLRDEIRRSRYQWESVSWSDVSWSDVAIRRDDGQ